MCADAGIYFLTSAVRDGVLAADSLLLLLSQIMCAILCAANGHRPPLHDEAQSSGSSKHAMAMLAWQLYGGAQQQTQVQGDNMAFSCSEHADAMHLGVLVHTVQA